MSAQLKHQIQIQEEQEAEVIYLVVPPTAHSASIALPAPFTMVERMALVYEEARYRAAKSMDHALATWMAIGMVAVVGYSLYTIKSFLGIDLFPSQHLEDFTGLPGYGRI